MTLLDTRRPIEGPAYDKTKPETREPWMQFRLGGVTATEIRDCGNGSRRREIIEAKRTGKWDDLSHVAAINHGNLREPKIAEWISRTFGIDPCDAAYASPENARWIASPDGVSRDPLTGELIVGTDDAILSEIKTSIHDLTPGRMDAEHVLLAVEPGSKFDLTGYYTQMQWQMLVMNAKRTLFVWEQRSADIDPATGTYAVLGTPGYAWIDRDDRLIQRLVDDVAPKLLAEIDAARGAEPAQPEALDAERQGLVAKYLDALRAEKAAAAVKAEAWKALQGAYLSTDDVARPDVSIEVPGLAKITKSTSRSTRRDFDENGARKKAPVLMSKYDALVERFTIESEVFTEKLTITAPKEIKK